MRMFDERDLGTGERSGNGGRRLLALTALALLAAQCAPAVKRDFSTVPAGRVGFDDMCGLQTYFDRLAMKVGTPPQVVSSKEIQGKGSRSGLSRFTFEMDSQLQAVRQVLRENWKRLPDELMTARRIEIQVRWSERSGVRRVVTNEDAELTVGDRETSLPYHVCLSELLFGEPLYRQRRVALGLAPLPISPPLVPLERRDAGMGDTATDHGTARPDGSRDAGASLH